MKLLNILGAVVAVHIAVLVLAIAIPGCRNTDRTPAPIAGNDDANFPATSYGSSPISSAPEMTDADLNPPLASDVPLTFDPNATAVGANGRSSPTRPNSAVGTALQTQSVVADVRPAENYTVQRGDNLWSLAKKNSLTVRELASANGLPADAGLRVGQMLFVPGKTIATPSFSSNVTPTADATSRTYEIRPGDTLGKIAQAHGTTVRELKAFNRLTSDMVRAGSRLAIPETAPVTPAAANDSPAAVSAPAASVAAGAFKHTVAPGESLTVIASRYGVKIGDIALANKVRDPSLIRPGQELVIPGWEAPTEPPEESAITTVTESPSSEAPVEDLDAGFGDKDVTNIPVITVEEPIKTIGGTTEDSPPVFE